MLKSPKVLRSSFQLKVEKFKKDKKNVKITSPRLSRSLLHLEENPQKERKLRCFSYSAEGYAKETATKINHDLNFLRKKVPF